MATVIPKQPRKERDQITIRLDRDVLETLEHYCRYLELAAEVLSSEFSRASLPNSPPARICLRRSSVFALASASVVSLLAAAPDLSGAGLKLM